MTARRPARTSITRLEARRTRRVAVLGAGGFIGSHLVPLLAARPGLSIIAVDRTFEKLPAQALTGAAAPVERVCAAIETPGLLDDVTGRADVVISLTALCNPALYNTQPLAVIDANYTDLVPLVRLCAARRRWLIHFSTCEVYGRAALDGNGRRMARMDEDATAMFLGPIHRERWTYAAAKQLLERLIWAHGHHEGLPFTIVRPFNVIGPRMDFIPGVDGEGIPRVLASFMHALLSRADLLLVDGGRQRRAFVDVGEFVEAVVRIVDRPAACAGQILNLGSATNDVTIRQLAVAVAGAFAALRPEAPVPRLVSVPAEKFYGVGYDDAVRRLPNVDKAARLLGWRATRTLPQMLPGIVADYLSRYEGALSAPPAARRAGGTR